MSPASIVFALGGGPAIEVELPINWSFRNGVAGSHGYNSLSIDGGTALGVGAYPITSVWSPTMERLYWLARTHPGERDERAERLRGASRYRQRTQLGSVGFRIDDHSRLIARWPYAEEDRSAMLDASGTPAIAFYPLENGLDLVLEYEFGLWPAAEFSEAIRLVVERIVSLTNPKPGEGLTTLYPLIRDCAARGIAIVDRCKVAAIEGRPVHLSGVFWETRPSILGVDAEDRRSIRSPNAIWRSRSWRAACLPS